MTVIVYVEGASDKQALTELLYTLLQQKRQEGIHIRFIERASKGDILTNGVRKALRILSHRADFHVVLLPDLYPPHAGGVRHETVDELVEGIWDRLRDIMDDWTVAPSNVEERFHVFCLKYELEALLLAAEESLRQYLDAERFQTSWNREVEDQNHNRPPGTIVRAIFRENGERYVKSEDAPEILARADVNTIAERCPQQFGSFVEFLASL